MTEANRSMDELPAILEERRKYEAWLAALDARRESTPKHVFERVKLDYEGRLRRVEDELSAHRHAIQEERANLSSRVALLEADEQLRRDERAELELRLHVGEIAGDDADSAFKAVDESLEHIVGEKDGLTKRIADLDLLLEPKSSQAAAAVAQTDAESAAGGASDEAPAATHPAGDAPADVGRRSGESAALMETTPVSMDPIPEAAHESAPPAAPTSAPASAPASVDPRHTPGGTFDELAFLSDLVGDGTRANKPAARDDAGTESLLAGLGDSTHRRSGEAPLGSNVPGHTPIAIRVSGAIEQVKTLKCTECGAMNYPTEWYCERCGAELAAL